MIKNIHIVFFFLLCGTLFPHIDLIEKANECHKCVRGAERESTCSCCLNTEQWRGTSGSCAADKLPQHADMAHTMEKERKSKTQVQCELKRVQKRGDLLIEWPT